MRELLVEDSEPRANSREIPLNSRNQKIKFPVVNQCDNTWPISLELCPGRFLNEQMLSLLKPQFCSITWLGHQQEVVDKNPALILSKQLTTQGYNNILLHLPGRNLNKFDAFRILNRARDIGIRNILALQGDPSLIRERDDAKCDFPYAENLVIFIKDNFGGYFKIVVAGYPDMHPNSRNLHEDLTHLRNKVSAGADLIITQGSFEYEAIENFCTNCRKFGIDVPIISGIYIVTSHKSLLAMSKFCAIPVPKEVMNVVCVNKDNSESLQAFGVEFATNIIRKILLNRGNLAGVHIFTLNNFEPVERVFRRLGLFGIPIERPLKLDRIEKEKKVEK